MPNRIDDAVCGTNCGHFAQAELQRDRWGHVIDGCKLKFSKRDDIRLSFQSESLQWCVIPSLYNLTFLNVCFKN